jgi:hypothetical protein
MKNGYLVASVAPTGGIRVMHHLRVQTCLVSDAHGRRGVVESGEFRTVLGVSGRRFPAVLSVAHALAPGGPAVHANVTLLEPAESLAFFPPGTQFEIWEGTRIGYGSVLGWR